MSIIWLSAVSTTLQLGIFCFSFSSTFSCCSLTDERPNHLAELRKQEDDDDEVRKNVKYT